MCAVDLADEIRLEETPKIELVSRGCPFPAEENLALRAAQLLSRRTGSGRGARIHLTKRIPIGAGLGGGSSDAAAVLAGLNELWGLGLKREELAELGAELGADVPFFLGASPARARGIGEVLEPAAVQVPGAFLIVVPPFGCPTPEVYRLYDELGGEGGRDAPFPNDLWPAARRLCPDLEGLRRALEGLGGMGTGLTGSGSGLFVAFPDEAAARRAARALAGKTSARLFVARPVPRGYKFVR
jgi:4-diphosphocytidyl-2-C-methyl-D-erythritol kinase